jgi:putative oxidoreductase
MKIAVIIVRIVMGLLFIVSSLGFFFNLMPQPELNASAKTFVIGMGVTGYLFPLVKVIELLCGIAFVVGRFVSLATVVIFPITVNILLFHAFLAPDGVIVPVLLFMGNLFLAFYYRKNYEMVLSLK